MNLLKFLREKFRTKRSPLVKQISPTPSSKPTSYSIQSSNKFTPTPTLSPSKSTPKTASKMVNSASNPIILYSHASGPNPWKISILLEELGLAYETRFKEFPDLKVEPYISLNPNGRVPAIEDRNTGIVLAESGAIIQYLIDTYDTEGRLTYSSSTEKYKLLQWLAFQISGQGPYFGQKAWFSNFHAEKVPSAEKRYADEIKRVLGVIDAHLVKQQTEYLVGNKVTYADLAWITWNSLLGWLVPDLDWQKEFPAFAAWNSRLLARPAVKKVLEAKAKMS
ncbi:MAG: glutathione S- transferase, nitrogen catabolite repression regulator [Bathelium mastoideum]|nr:MAG: glutathione S- transferase, nitrogen catabolite repression regulator [Bathelium mastoideum]KAI9686740.1 MAG: glutathione S- transferase, nitrogen catabolite repression regulator [Bathelium mastoideum]